MPFLDFLQSLPLPILCAATVALSLLAGWLILGGVRVTLRLRGWDPTKPVNVPELATITSVLFALLLSFSAAGVWNDWQQAQGAVRREALALENVLGLANGLPAERAAKLKERVVSYAKAAPNMNGRPWRTGPTWTIQCSRLWTRFWRALPSNSQARLPRGMPHRSHQCSCRRFLRRAARA